MVSIHQKRTGLYIGLIRDSLKKRSLQVHPMVEKNMLTSSLLKWPRMAATSFGKTHMTYWEARTANGCTHEVSPKNKGMSNHQQSNHGLRSNMARNKLTFGDDLRIKRIIHCRICLWQGNHFFFHCLPLPVQKLWVLLCEALPAGILLIIPHNNPMISHNYSPIISSFPVIIS